MPTFFDNIYWNFVQVQLYIKWVTLNELALDSLTSRYIGAYINTDLVPDSVLPS